MTIYEYSKKVLKELVPCGNAKQVLLFNQTNQFLKMKTQKMSFKDIKDVLSRDEMRAIMAGSESEPKYTIYCRDANNNVLGILNAYNCDTALSDCRSHWPSTDNVTCGYS